MTTVSEMQTAIEKSLVNMDRLDRVVNGGVTETISTDGGLVKSVAKWQADLQAIVEAGLSTSTVSSIVGLQAALDTKQGKIFTNVKDLGALGNGSANDTAAFVSAISAGGTIYVPAGTYMLDYITISTKVHIIVSNSAVLKQRVPASPSTTLDNHWGIFKIITGADGSIIEGATFDGNRAALAPYYNGYTRLGKDNHWWGVRAEFVNDVTLLRCRFQNFFYEGWYAFNCERFRALDFDIADCGVAFQAQGSSSISKGWVIRGTCRNIGNVISGTAYYIFQHGLTIGLLENSVVQVTMDNYCGSKVGVDNVSTGGGKEPVPIAMNLYLLDRCSVDISVDGYTTPVGLQSIHQGINFSSVNNCYGRMASFGFEQAIAFCSSSSNTFDVAYDGDYVNVAGYSREGILFTHGGVSPPNEATLAGEAGSNLSSRDNVLRGTVQRFGIGIRDEAEANDIGGVSVIGCVTDGVQLVVAAGTSGSYPGTRRRPSGFRDMGGTTVLCNGNAGIIYTGGQGDRIYNCISRDNGQTFGSRAQPHNLSVFADSGEGVGLQIVANDIDVTPSVYVTNEFSFKPGTATAKPALKTYSSGTALTHTFPIVVRNANNYRIGEIIRLKAALTGGADVDGKIVDIKEDTVTLAFSSAVTFSDSGVLDTLTGTASTTGINVVGVGTSFISQIDFPMYLKYESEYRRIVYVNSNTSAVIDSPFTTNMPAGSTISVVRGDIVTGIINPSYGLYVNANVTGPMLLKGNIANNVDSFVNAGSFTGIAPGSQFELQYSLTMTGTALDNAIVVGLPNHTQVRAVETLNVTAITGITGSANIEVKQASAGATIATAITGLAVTFGAVNRGAIPNAPAFGAFGGRVNLVSSAGNPSGTIRLKLSMEKLLAG